MDFRIRREKVSDIDKVQKFVNSMLKASHLRYTNQTKPFDKKRKERAEKDLKSKKKIILLAENRDRIIGSAGIGIRPGRTRFTAGVGWTVHQDYIRKGVATALMKEIIKIAKKKGLKRLEAEIVPENKASVALAKDFDFKIEGRKKKAFKGDDGKFHDLLVVGKLL